MIGTTKDELGASEYYRMLADQQGTPDRYGGQVPTVDIDMALKTYRAMNEATDKELLRSSHTPTLGGFAAAFALATAGGALGAEIDLASAPQQGGLDNDALLFSESNSRFVVTCKPEDAEQLETIFSDIPMAKVGKVTKSNELRIRVGDETLTNVATNELSKAFKQKLYGI